MPKKRQEPVQPLHDYLDDSDCFDDNIPEDNRFGFLKRRADIKKKKNFVCDKCRRLVSVEPPVPVLFQYAGNTCAVSLCVDCSWDVFEFAQGKTISDAQWKMLSEIQIQPGMDLAGMSNIVWELLFAENHYIHQMRRNGINVIHGSVELELTTKDKQIIEKRLRTLGYLE